MSKERYEREVEKRKELQKVLKADLDRQVARDQEVKAKMEGFKVEHGDDMGEEAKKYASEVDRLQTGTGGSGLRRKIEEAMERDEEFRRKRAENTASGGKGDKSDES
jgi:hypothetical protein